MTNVFKNEKLTIFVVWIIIVLQLNIDKEDPMSNPIKHYKTTVRILCFTVAHIVPNNDNEITCCSL